jgi:protein-tyrosine phosphatase
VSDPIRIVTLCTGNAARSVMAGFFIDAFARDLGLSVEVVTAGTHAIEGQPMSQRTKTAILAIDGVGEPAVGSHRSHQLTEGDVVWADLIIAMERDHLRYVRRVHGDGGANKAMTLPVLAAEFPEDGTPVTERVAAAAFGARELEGLDEVDDPAGGEVEVYHACAEQIAAQLRQLLPRLSAPR